MTAVETRKEKWCRAEVHRIAGEIALKSPEQDVAKAKPILIAHSLLRANSKQSPGKLRAAMSMARLWHDQVPVGRDGDIKFQKRPPLTVKLR